MDVSSGILALGEVAAKAEDDLHKAHQATMLTDAQVALGKGARRIDEENRRLPWDQKVSHLKDGWERLRAETFGSITDQEVLRAFTGEFERNYGSYEAHTLDDAFKGESAHNIAKADESMDDSAWRAANARSDAERQIALQSMRAIPGNLRAGGFIDEVKERAMVADGMARADLFTAKEMIAANPHEAKALLSDSKAAHDRFPGLDPLQIEALQPNADAEINEKDFLKFMQWRAGVERNLTAGTPNPVTPPPELSPKIAAQASIAADNYLQQLANDPRAKALARFNEIQGRAYFNPANADDRAAVNAGWGYVSPDGNRDNDGYGPKIARLQMNQIAQMIGPDRLAALQPGQNPMSLLSEEQRKVVRDDTAHAITNIVSNLAIVPSDVKDQVQGPLSSASATPQEKIDAAVLFTKLAQANPQLAGQFDDKYIREANLIFRNMQSGHTEKDAAGIASEQMKLGFQMTDDERQRVAGFFNKENAPEQAGGPTKTQAYVDGLGKSGFWPFATNANITANVRARFDAMVHDEYVNHGSSFDAALNTAALRFQREYQVSNVNGKTEMMRATPEANYGIGSLSPEDNAAWIRKQAIEDFKGASGAAFKGEIVIRPWPITNQVDPKTGGALYQVGVDGGPGIGMTWQVKPWAPDPAREIKRLSDESKKKTEELMKQRELKKESAKPSKAPDIQGLGL
jgi:hypothetical protein